jgi:hypothetical protein
MQAVRILLTAETPPHISEDASRETEQHVKSDAQGLMMAIAQIQENFALSGMAFGAVFLLLSRRRSRIRESAIDSPYQRILDRRLKELREECLEPSTLRHIAEQIHSISDAGHDRLCLPAPQKRSIAHHASEDAAGKRCLEP